MKRAILLSIVFLVVTHLNAKMLDTTTILFKIKDQKTSVFEFKKSYQKSKQTPSVFPLSEDQFLDLYINFKLKVLSAKEQGLDTFPKTKREVYNYREKLKDKYLRDTRITIEMVKEAYERLVNMVRVSHILIKIKDKKGDDSDTLEALKRITKIRKLAIKKDADFKKLAIKYSEDPSVKDNGGDLGFFDVFKMVYPFESMAFNTKINKVSHVFRTIFGYHLLKVTDKLPSPGIITASHIVIKPKSKDSTGHYQANKKINEIYDLIEKKIKTFEECIQLFSEDEDTKNKGGKLAPFAPGDLLPEFYDKVIQIKSVGNYSKPFKTKYGYHIVKLIEREKFEEYDKMKNYLKKRIRKDDRVLRSIKATVEKLKNEYNYKLYTKAVNESNKLIDSNYFTDRFDTSNFSKYKKVIFEFTPFGEKKSFKVFQNQLLEEYIKPRGVLIKKKIPISVLHEKMLEQLEMKTIIKKEDEKLEEKFPDFKFLVNEYNQGLLLYEIMQEKVWNKSLKDTIGLELFLNNNKEKYKLPRRVEATVYNCKDLNVLNRLKKTLKKNKKIIDAELIKEMNKASELNLSIEHLVIALDKQSEFLKDIEIKEGKSKIIKDKNQYFVINKILKSRYSNIDDVRGKVIGEYQKYLELEWLKELKKKYKIEVNREVFNKVKNEFDK